MWPRQHRHQEGGDHNRQEGDARATPQIEDSKWRRYSRINDGPKDGNVDCRQIEDDRHVREQTTLRHTNRVNPAATALTTFLLAARYAVADTIIRGRWCCCWRLIRRYGLIRRKYSRR